MEWVETTARTVDEAKSLALDQLGVDTDEAEFEVIDEPRPGLFGRLRGEARVRARVMPTRPRPKMERRDRRQKKDSADDTAAPVREGVDDDTGSSPGAESSVQRQQPARRKRQPKDTPRLQATEVAEVAEVAEAPTTDSNTDRPEQSRTTTRRKARTNVNNDEQQSPETTVDAATVGAEATKFLEGLLTAFDLEGQVTCAQDGNELDVRVDGSDLGLLVGPRGSTLVAVQDLARVVSQRRLGDHETRLRVDVAGYRERRREALTRFAMSMADEVVASGVARVLEPMASADRKVIHDVIGERTDVVSRSEGDDPQRRVIIDLPS